jgi:hypothetical protein
VNKPPIASLFIGASLVDYFKTGNGPLLVTPGRLNDPPARKPPPRCAAVLKAEGWDVEMHCDLREGHAGHHEVWYD